MLVAITALVAGGLAIGVYALSDSSRAANASTLWLALALVAGAMPTVRWLRRAAYWRRPMRQAVARADIASLAELVLIEVSADGRIVWAQGAAEAVLGYRLSQLRGKTLWQLELTECVPATRVSVKRTRQSARAADGSLRTVEVAFHYEANGYMFGMLRPGTDPMLSERAADEAEARLVEADGSALKALLASAQNGMALVDVGGYPIFANSAFYEFFAHIEPRGSLPSVVDAVTSGSAELRAAIASVGDRDALATRAEIRLSGFNGEQREVLASISPYRIRGNVEGALLELADITEERRAVREIERLARYDELTSLPNRRYFEQLVRERLDASNGKTLSALMLLDLDRFKGVNDSLGHAAGDELLMEVSRRLRAAFGHLLLFGRIGGDEFLGMIPDLEDITQASTFAAEIQRVLASPLRLGEIELNLSASIGVAIYPRDGLDFETLTRRADLAMYRAKRRGGGESELVDIDDDREMLDEMELRSVLRQAFERSEFEIHYQLQFTTDDLRPCGTEALLRWNNPRHGLVLPKDFLPCLERSGLIVQVGEWVLRSACAEVSTWKGPLSSLSLSVNVAARQLLTTGFAEMVRRVIAETGIDPERLELEVTEAAGLDDLDMAIDILGELRATGIKIAIDDFGTGHSSLLRLKSLPVDTLKLDRSFIADMASADGRALVDGMVGMGHALGMFVVAEGVETTEQLAVLRMRGCDAVQGFLLAEAIPASKLDERIRQPATSKSSA